MNNGTSDNTLSQNYLCRRYPSEGAPLAGTAQLSATVKNQPMSQFGN